MGESVGRPVVLVGVSAKRGPRRTSGAELALRVVAGGLVPFVAHGAEVGVVNVAIHEIAQTGSMDGHGEKLQLVAQRRAAWLMMLVALRSVRNVSVRPVVWLMNCLPPAGWLPNEVPAAG